MASPGGSTVAEYQALVGSLRDIVKKDAQLLDDRGKLLDALTKLTERNEILVQEQNKMREKYKDDQKVQSNIMAALEKQNDLLRQRVKDQEDEISGLEKEVAGLRDQLSIGSDCDVKGGVTSADVRAKLANEEQEKIDEDLIEAAHQGKVEEIEVLVANGADINAVDRSLGETALIYATLNDRLKIVEVLLANGADIDATDRGGRTALICAAFNGRNHALEALINRGASTDIISSGKLRAIIEVKD